MRHHATAWLAWSLVTLSVVLLVGGIALARTTRLADPELYPYDPELYPYGGVVDAVLSLATVLTFSVVGAIVASRHPRNTIGWIFCSIGLVVGLNALARGYAEFWIASSSGPRSLGETAAWFGSWSWTILVFVPTSFLLLLFPDGRLPSPRWRPVAWCAAIGLIGFVAGNALQPGPLGDFPKITNPYGVHSPILDAIASAGYILASASMVASAVSLIVRMRRAGRAQRQQIKWLAYGGALVVGAVFVSGVISIWSGDAAIAVIGFGLLGLPIFTGVAIARYRLYDIDLEAAPIGGQPFAQDISRRDCTAFLLLFDTYDTRLLAQALSAHWILPTSLQCLGLLDGGRGNPTVSVRGERDETL